MGLFNQLRLQTPESVELEFVLAGIGNRALAYVIDYLIVTVSLIFLWSFYAMLLIYIDDNDRLVQWSFAIVLLLSFAIYVGYYVFFETIWRGQTPGKKLLKIRAIQENGRPVGLTQASLRALLRPLDDLFFLGALMIILGNREKRLGDWLAATVVIQEESHPNQPTLLISPAAHQLCPSLLAKTNPSNLLPDEFSTLKEYLERRTSMTSKARLILSQNLARRFHAILELETEDRTPPDIFLEAVYLAYQQYKND